MLETASQLIDGLGGTQSVAKLLNVGPSAVSNYRKGGFPERAYYRLAQACQARGLIVSDQLFGGPAPQASRNGGDTETNTTNGTSALNDRLVDIFAQAGFKPIATPILQSVEPFLDRLGEEMRRRLYTVTSPSGKQLCLRPDLTIPTALYYLENNQGTPARYCYQGAAFRYQPRGVRKPEEFTQTGFEIIGGESTANAKLKDEMEMLQLVIEAIKQIGIKDYEIRLNDLSLFDCFIAELGLTPRTQKRLQRSFRNEENFQTILQKLSASVAEKPNLSDNNDKISDKGRDLNAPDIENVVENVINGRSVAEIKTRFEQKQDSENAPLNDKQRTAISAYLSIKCPIKDIATAFGTIFPTPTKQFKADIDELQTRMLKITQAADITPSNIIFSPQYGRKFAYYTGLAFELHVPVLGAQRIIASGGRYDDLIGSLQTGKAAKDIIVSSACGAAIASERLYEAAQRQGANL